MGGRRRSAAFPDDELSRENASEMLQRMTKCAQLRQNMTTYVGICGPSVTTVACPDHPGGSRH